MNPVALPPGPPDCDETGSDWIGDDRDTIGTERVT